jgi:methylase of polypeptide subunit release factors
MRELSTENFLEDFGAGSPAFRFALAQWLEVIEKIRELSDYQATYHNWRKYLRIAYGTAEGDEHLFVRHTYLATLAKLIAYVCITRPRAAPGESLSREIIEGTFFEKQRITNFLEGDFFSWVGQPDVMGVTQRIASHVVSLLLTYQMRELSEDVMKELYQELVDPKDRHDLGEYYTPDWLAARMCGALLSKSGEEVVLDPACGSGTFLYQAIEHKKRHLPRTRQSLEKILGSVVGIDIHPLAVIVSKVNVLLALGDLFQKRYGPVSIQVFLADSIRHPLKQPFLAKQFDVVIGNPPWLSFRFVEKGEYQDYLKRLIVKECGLLEGAGHLITHLELGTLFFVRCAALYLKPTGRIGFVLPRSIFSADQHDRFRRSNGHNHVRLTEIWDLEEVSPLFKVPAAAAFGDLKCGAVKTLPGDVLSGQLKRKNSSLAEAKVDLRFAPTQFHVVEQGKRSFLSTARKKISAARSFYQRYFKEGATIVPRNFWFVEFKAFPGLGRDFSRPLVATDARAEAEAKPPYKGTRFEAPIEADFLYATLLSTDLLPFGHFDFRPVILPLVEEARGYRLIDSAQARAKGCLRLAEWLERAQEIWTRLRKEKAKRGDVLSWLNYRNKLTDQYPRAQYVVLYPTSATFLCAAVVRSKELTHKVGSQEVALRRFVSDAKTYAFETAERKEAQYLVAVLNSPTVDSLIKPMQARGLWGPRDIHKKVWELPIPEFDEENRVHMCLAEIAEACEGKVKEMLPDLRQEGSIGRARATVRQALKDQLADIDSAVQEILK